MGNRHPASPSRLHPVPRTPVVRLAEWRFLRRTKNVPAKAPSPAFRERFWPVEAATIVPADALEGVGIVGVSFGISEIGANIGDFGGGLVYGGPFCRCRIRWVRKWGKVLLPLKKYTLFAARFPFPEIRDQTTSFFAKIRQIYAPNFAHKQTIEAILRHIFSRTIKKSI